MVDRRHGHDHHGLDSCRFSGLVGRPPEVGRWGVVGVPGGAPAPASAPASFGMQILP
jgi:hypothetical protein